MTATDLCEHCEEDKATISRALDYLESNGFITRPSETSKRYKSPLYLTDLGREVGKKISDKVNGVLDDVSRCLTEKDRAVFYRALSAISDNLDAISKNNE